MSQRKWLFAGAAVLALLLASLSAGASGTMGRAASGTQPVVMRVERVIRYPERWSSECDFDDCGISLLLQLPVTTPRSIEKVDVVMTTTLDYRTSTGDFGVASAGIARSRGGRTVAVMRPRRWPLAPSAARSTTTTLTWVKKSLDAEGRRYLFEMSIPSREGTDPAANQNMISGRKLAVVIELTPSG